MGLFKKKPKPGKVKVAQIGNVVLVDGRAYRVDPTGLIQLPIKKIGVK